MIKYIVAILFICSLVAGQRTGRVWIFLEDKDKNIPYALSQEAIGRHLAKSKFKSLDDTDLPVSANYISQLQKAGVKIYRKSRWFNAVSAYVDPVTMSKVERFTFVKLIEPVKQFTYQLPTRKQSRAFFKPGNNIYGLSYDQNVMIGIPDLHDKGYVGQGVRVALFDTGFILEHEALQQVQVIAQWDFINNDPDVSNQTGDVISQHNHGTEVLGIIGGYKVGALVGPAYASAYLLAKTEDITSETHREEDNWAAAAEWADSIGVDIISSSLGYSIFDAAEDNYTYEDMDGKTTIVTRAAVKAVEKGIAVFVSAGNEGSNAWRYITAPADGDGVIAVGAVLPDGTYWTVSSQGPTWDNRLKPEVAAQGTNVYTVSPRTFDQYITGGGTSFSCPLAAGAGAIILSMNPNLTPLELRDWLTETATQSRNPDNFLGYGIIDLQRLYVKMTSTPNVKISDFKVEMLAGRNKVSWTVLEEIQNRYWIVMRQNAEGKVEEIGRIAGEHVSFLNKQLIIIDEDVQAGSYYHYYLLAELVDEEQRQLGNQEVITPTPAAFTLLQNYPNPFNQTTKLVAGITNSQKVTLKIYNIQGRLVRTLFENRLLQENYHVISWDGKNDGGERLASGIYYATCLADGQQQTIKMIYLK
jgi:serine protease AprX